MKKKTTKRVATKTVAPKKNITRIVGSWAFIIGILLAVVMGFISTMTNFSTAGITTLTTLFVILGIIVGLLNITHEESLTFLWASVALVIVSVLGGGIFGGVALVGDALSTILGMIIVFIVPITIIVALRIVYLLGYTK